MLVSKNLGTSSLIHIGEMLDKFSKFEKYGKDDFWKQIFPHRQVWFTIVTFLNILIFFLNIFQ